MDCVVGLRVTDTCKLPDARDGAEDVRPFALVTCFFNKD